MERLQGKGLLRRGAKRGLTVVFITILAILVIWLVHTIVSLPQLNVKDGKIARRIDFVDTLYLFKKEPSGRNVSWDSELPTWIKKDIEYAKEKEYDIVYSVTGYQIYISLEENGENVYVRKQDFTDYGYNDFVYSLENFSIYRNKNNEIVIYGFSYEGNWFMKYLLGREVSNDEVLTYDINIPFDQKDNSVRSISVFDEAYSVFLDKNTFYFYKEGNVVASQEFHKDISKSSLNDSIILTTDNQLYIVYVKMDNSKPVLTFKNAGNVDDLNNRDYLISEDGISIPIVEQGGKKYVIVPNDWEMFKSSSLAEANVETTIEYTDYSVNLVLLEDLFKSATIRYNDLNRLDPRWIAKICFELNGKEFFDQSFDIDGYDSSIELPEEIYTKYETTVYSLDAFWKHIENIRTVYFDYYNHEGL